MPINWECYKYKEAFEKLQGYKFIPNMQECIENTGIGYKSVMDLELPSKLKKVLWHSPSIEVKCTDFLSGRNCEASIHEVLPADEGKRSNEFFKNSAISCNRTGGYIHHYTTSGEHFEELHKHYICQGSLKNIIIGLENLRDEMIFSWDEYIESKKSQGE